MSRTLEIVHGDVRALVHPLENDHCAPFAFELELDCNDRTSMSRRALQVGEIAGELLMTDLHGTPADALITSGGILEGYMSPADRTLMGTLGGKLQPTSMWADLGMPGYFIPRGHEFVQLLTSMTMRDLPDEPQGLHQDALAHPNAPDVVMLRPETQGSTLRVGSDPEPPRSTLVASGTHHRRLLERRIATTGIDVDIDSLVHATNFTETFSNPPIVNDRFHALGIRLDHPSRHRVSIRDTMGRISMLRVGSFARCIDMRTGTRIHQNTAEWLQNTSDELLQEHAATTLLAYEPSGTSTAGRVTGETSIIHKAAFHGRAYDKYSSATSRVMAVDPSSYRRIRSLHGRPPEVPPPGYKQRENPEFIGDVSYDECVRWALEGHIATGLSTLDQFFAARVGPYYAAAQSQPNAVELTLRYAEKRRIPLYTQPDIEGFISGQLSLAQRVT